MLRKIEGRRRRGRQRLRWLDGITNSMDMGLGGLRGGPPTGVCSDPAGAHEFVRQEEAEVRWRSEGLPRREEAEPVIRVIGWPRWEGVRSSNGQKLTSHLGRSPP